MNFYFWLAIFTTPVFVALLFAYIRIMLVLVKDGEKWMAAFLGCIIPAIIGVPALLLYEAISH